MRLHTLLAPVLLSLPLAALAQAPTTPLPPDHPPMGKAAPGSANPHAGEAPSPWSELADYTLTVKVPPKGDTGTWKFRTFADPADVVIDLDTPGAGGRTKGSMMLVGGQAMAAKGFTPEAGFEVDAIDAAVINLKILTRLLDAAAPRGPTAVKGRLAVNTSEVKRPILAATPTSNARFDAPWTLKGSVERVDADTFAFALDLEVPAGDKPGQRAKWTFRGKAGGSPAGRALADSTSLAGWTAWRLGPKDPKQTHTTLKFAATRLDAMATVKDLRAYLARPAAAVPAAATKKP